MCVCVCVQGGRGDINHYFSSPHLSRVCVCVCAYVRVCVCMSMPYLCAGAVDVDGVGPGGGAVLWGGLQQQGRQSLSLPAVGEAGVLLVELVVQGAAGRDGAAEDLRPGRVWKGPGQVG